MTRVTGNVVDWDDSDNREYTDAMSNLLSDLSADCDDAEVVATIETESGLIFATRESLYALVRRPDRKRETIPLSIQVPHASIGHFIADAQKDGRFRCVEAWSDDDRRWVILLSCHVGSMLDSTERGDMVTFDRIVAFKIEVYDPGLSGWIFYQEQTSWGDDLIDCIPAPDDIARPKIETAAETLPSAAKYIRYQNSSIRALLEK